MIIDQISHQPQIEANRFILRPLRRSDAGAIGMHMADKRVAQATPFIPHPLPPGATEAFIKRATCASKGEAVWVMDGEGSERREVLGMISLNRLDREQSQLSYWVAPGFWNSGLASEAVTALIKANPLKNREIFAEVFQDNPVSARVLTNSKFQYIGDAESHSVARRVNVPTWTYIRKMG
ncbi:MAG: GNAT family N-acetyltransferase [Rhodobacteraceae bacterium]|nr:GNAT family N-acetyltransferase [Paracoccaceae bacterium]